MAIKLNLGCGSHKLEGFLNVDNSPHCNPDKIMDLEVFPWPFADNSVSEIIMSHVLEHIGQSSEGFKKIIQELYRVAVPNCKITIAVPDPYHDNFWGDPTHCRPITTQMLSLLSRSFLAQFKGSSITPIAIMWEVDMQISKLSMGLDKKFVKWAKQHNIELSQENIRYYRNAVQDHTIDMLVHKPPRDL